MKTKLRICEDGVKYQSENLAPSIPLSIHEEGEASIASRG
jgi:hypothetical protein